MNSQQILALIQQVAAEPKKTRKLSLLGEHAGSDELRKVLEWALSPFKRFGVRQLPDRRGNGNALLGDAHWALLSKLVSRELSGAAARAAIQSAFDELDALSAQLLALILKKDLRAGFSESTVNKVFPGLIAEFPYMRCSQPKEVKLEKWPWAEGVFSQLKADGMFMNVSVEADQVEFRSRQGSEFTLDALGELVDTVRASLTAGFQYHGELLVQRADGNTWSTLPRAESNGVMNSLGKG